MKQLTLNEVLETMYSNRITFIKDTNIELEREYFYKIADRIPMGAMMNGQSYEDIFNSFKRTIKYKNKVEIENIFEILEDFLLFSAGHDMIFKHKLKADLFNTVPIKELIYPMLQEDIKNNFNDVSIMKENPNFNKNIKEIDEKIYTYTELSSLLFLLYSNNFLFPTNWENEYQDTYKQLLEILKNSQMTIGDFLHALVDYKCNLMNIIFNEISDLELKKHFFVKTKNLREKKHNETNTFVYINLPIDYFFTHTPIDFINKVDTPSILTNKTNTKNKPGFK